MSHHCQPLPQIFSAHLKLRVFFQKDLENMLEHYLKDTYWSIYSGEPKDAVIVVELVKQYIEEMESVS